MTIGKMFLAAMVAQGTVSDLLSYGSIHHLFKGNEVVPYEFMRDFAKKYQAIPDTETIEKHTNEEITEAKEPPSYYLDLLRLRYIEAEVKKAAKDALDLLKPENKDPQAALAVFAKTAMEVAVKQTSSKIVDFRDAYERIIPDYAAKLSISDQYGLRFGWKTLDDMTGGLIKGDVVSFVGRPAQGKTWQMLYAAHHGWHENHADQEHNHSRMFISMEMNGLLVEQRLSSMQVHLPMTKLKNADLTSKQVKEVLKPGLKLIKNYGHPFWVVDANLAASVEDIWMLVRQLNPGAVFIDGAYLLTHPTEKDRYRRAAENVELLKKEISPICPVVASWQFAKTASNKKKGEKATMDDIGYSDAIAQVSSLALGLFQEEAVDTLVQRRVEILKGRSGEVGSFTTNWDFVKMDFSEYQEQSVEDLQFI